MILALLLAAALPAAAAPRLDARCDARVDVLGVVQTLAGRRKAEPPLPPSMADVTTRFAAWKGHPAVTTYARIADERGGAEAYVLVLSALGEPPAFAWPAPRPAISRDFIDASGGDEALEAFLRDLRDFSRRSGVMKWLAARAGECRAARRAASAVAGADPVGEVEAYLGRRLDAAGLLALSLIYTPDAYTSYILPYPYDGDRVVQGPFRVFSVLTPSWDETGRPRFAARGAPLEFYYLAAEPAYVRHRAAFEARAGLLPGFGAACRPSWHTCALHLLVSALERRVAARRGEKRGDEGDAAALAVRRLERALASDYEPGLAAGRYRSIDDFWPRLIEALGPETPAR